jgi:hypothetical protein
MGELAMSFKEPSIQILSASRANPARRARSSKGVCRSRNWRANSQDDVVPHRVLIVVGFLAAALLVHPAMAADPPPTQGVPTQSGRSFWGAIVAPDTSKQNRKAFWALFSGATATNILDIEYTQHLLHESPNAYETNPVYGRRPSRLVAYPISFGIQAGYALVAYGLQRRRIKFLWTAPLLYVTFQHLEGLEEGIKVQRQLDGMRGR